MSSFHVVSIWLLSISSYYFRCVNCNGDQSDVRVRIFLSGDTMLARGIDQILKHPLNPKIPPTKARPWGNATYYIQKLPSHETTSQSRYIWGDLIESFTDYKPDLKLFNIENSITSSYHHWENKGIWYHMNPENIYVLNELNQDNRLVCTLANNHVLDYRYVGLNETMQTLTENNIHFCGIGHNIAQAWEPAVIEIEDKNCTIFVFGVGSRTSGVFPVMAATQTKAGVCMVDPLNSGADYIESIMKKIQNYVLAYTEGKEQKQNIIILSIHWGSNFNWDIRDKFKTFAHALIDYGDDSSAIGIDLIHGHSSHHIKGFEIYKNKAIFYGTGETIDDYEGIGGGSWHMDLGFLYFVDLNVLTGDVSNVILKGTQIKHFRINYAQNASLTWLHKAMKRLCADLNVTLFVSDEDQTLRLNYVVSEELKQESQDRNFASMVTFINSGSSANELLYFYWSLLIIVMLYLRYMLRQYISY